jgi:hypothetical protein
MKNPAQSAVPAEDDKCEAELAASDSDSDSDPSDGEHVDEGENGEAVGLYHYLPSPSSGGRAQCVWGKRTCLLRSASELRRRPPRPHPLANDSPPDLRKEAGAVYHEVLEAQIEAERVSVALRKTNAARAGFTGITCVQRPNLSRFGVTLASRAVAPHLW